MLKEGVWWNGTVGWVLRDARVCGLAVCDGLAWVWGRSPRPKFSHFLDVARGPDRAQGQTEFCLVPAFDWHLKFRNPRSLREVMFKTRHGENAQKMLQTNF